MPHTFPCSCCTKARHTMLRFNFRNDSRDWQSNASYARFVTFFNLFLFHLQVDVVGPLNTSLLLVGLYKWLVQVIKLIDNDGDFWRLCGWIIALLNWLCSTSQVSVYLGMNHFAGCFDVAWVVAWRNGGGLYARRRALQWSTCDWLYSSISVTCKC